MPMEAGSAAMSTTIQPIQRPREEPGTSSNIQREGAATSPFAPKTNVNIQNSVANMAGILSKISSSQEGSMESLSPQLQKLIDNIMEQSFSLETTLAEGLGSTVESQRFSVDQLLTLSRMLGQLGALAEQGVTNPLDDRLETLLTDLKQFFRQTDGLGLEPALLHKLAFELLDEKTTEDLPPELRYLLQQAMGGSNGNSLTAPSESLGFLKQLLQFFLPVPERTATETGTGQGETTPQEAAQKETVTGQREGADQTSGTGANEAGANRGADVPQTGQMAAPKGQTPENARSQETSLPRGTGEGAAEGKTGTGQGISMPNGSTAEKPAASVQQRQPESTAENQNRPAGEDIRGTNTSVAARQGTTTASLQPQSNAREPVTSGKSSESMPGEKAAPQNSAETSPEGSLTARPEGTLARSLFQNTPQTMETMKQMATLILRDATLTAQDTRLLQNFVNNQPGMLSEKDAKQLQLLLRLCQNNIPASVQQAAQQQNLPDLPKLWVFMQLCDLAYLKDKNNAASLKKASRDVAEFASMMRGAMASENSQATEGQRSMSFMVPLYMGDQEKTAFPAYIHVYDENEEDPAAPGERKKETWLRVCLLTENIGAVDLTFRMYEKRNLDVRVLFSEPKMIQAFGEYIPEFEESFIDTPLVLKDLKVALAGDPNG